MKKEIHPTYHKGITVACACGNTFKSGSTLKEINIEVCSNCHPYYTGEGKILQAGRVDKFNQKLAKKTTKSAVVKPKKTTEKSA